MNSKQCKYMVDTMVSKMPVPDMWEDASFEMIPLPDLVPCIANSSKTASIKMTPAGTMYECTIGNTHVTDISPAAAFKRAFSVFNGIVEHYESIRNTLKEDLISV